jgi:hypothetical protein
MAVVRDPTHAGATRVDALIAFQHATEGRGRESALLDLLAAIQEGRIEDSQDELLGLLLEHLYPAWVQAERLIDSLHPPKNPNLTGSYSWFWTHHLLDKAHRADLPVLMDSLVAARRDGSIDIEGFHLRTFAGRLLTRSVELHGAAVAPERLYSWLGLGLDRETDSFPLLAQPERARLSAWLTRHPRTYVALVEYGLHTGLGKADLQRHMYRLQDRLLGAAPPPNYPRWCLARAEREATDAAAHWLFDEAFSTLVSRQGWEGFPLDSWTHWVESRPRFQPWLVARLTQKVAEYQVQDAQIKLELRTEQAARQAKWIDYFRGHYRAVLDGSAPPKVLHELGMIYRGRHHDAVGDTPRERLQSFLGADETLVRMALDGLRLALEREDLPSESEILALGGKGRELFYLEEPCLIGAEEVYASSPGRFLSLDDSLLRRLVAFHATPGRVRDGDPKWLLCLARDRSDLVAEILTKAVTALLKGGVEAIDLLYSLAREAEFREVAKLAVPSLLHGFPPRARQAQHKSLGLLLECGLRHLEQGPSIDAIDARLKRPGLGSGQRAIWLAAGFALEPARYETQVERALSTSQKGAATLVEYLARFLDVRGALPDIPPSSAAMLIRTLGSTCAPPAFAVPRSTDGAAELADALIGGLANRSQPDAGAALVALLGERPLAPWHPRLRRAIEKHRLNRREATFSIPSPREVAQALENREPASPCDLRALVLDHLETIAYALRHGDTDGWRAFWDGDVPAPENACRDRLLDLLRPRLLPLGIEAQKEGWFAQDKRADIRVSHRAGVHVVPIEIKKDNHRELWRALRGQLMALYAPDPAAKGHGIYLVLWLGGSGMPMPPSGPKPRDPTALKEALLAQLDPRERPKVAVVVLDCSRPPP